MAEDDDNYSWLDEHSTDPRRGSESDGVRKPAPLPPESLKNLPTPPPLPPPASSSAIPPLPPTSPDGSVTYTSSGSNDVAASYGTGPSMAEAADVSASTYRPSPPSGRTPPPLTIDGRPPSVWHRYFSWRIAMGVVVLLVAGVIGAVTTRGTSDASRLDPGDCFEIPPVGRVDRVNDQDCDEPHEAEVYAEVSGRSDEIGLRCDRAWEDVLAGSAYEIPYDAQFAILEGTLRHSCVIESPSGSLVGSILD